MGTKRLRRPVLALPNLVALPISPDVLRHWNPIQKLQQSESALSGNEISDPYKAAVIGATNELRSVIELALHFLQPAPENFKDQSDWLAELKGSLDELEEAIWRGDLNIKRSIDSEGISYLKHVLSDYPEIGDDHDEIPDEFSKRMLAFWMDEVNRRGWELFHISLQSVDVLGARDVFMTMKKLPYPVR